jgi:glucosamine kinase
MSEGAIVAIDGGGTKTLVATADVSGVVRSLRRGRATSPLESRTWTTDLEEQVLPVVRSHAGLLAVAAALPAYGEVEAVSAAQRQAIAGLFGAVPQRVLNDVDAAHLGAFAGGPGILVLAGTGSMAWARDDAGQSLRTGGWGEVIGDEGSGYWIGRRILEAVSKSLDGRAAPTALVDAVFEHLGLDRSRAVSSFEGWASTLAFPRLEIAALAPLAPTVAGQGDATAAAVVRDAALELARHVQTLEARLGRTPDWSYAGGLFRSPMMLDAVADCLGRPPVPPKLPPIGGAFVAAAQHLGLTPDRSWIERLAHSLEHASASIQTSQSTN